MRKMKIVSICGSPRKGNSEATVMRLKEIFEQKGVENEIILLRSRNIQRCGGCVEYCNKHLRCCHNDDMAKIIQKMLKVDGYVFVSPNYFAMPPGLFKDFIDKCSVLYTSYYFEKEPGLSKKKALVITVCTDKKFVDACKDHVAKWFCETLRMDVVAKKGFLSKSELKGNYNDIFENKLNPNIDMELENIAEKLYNALKKR
jgi:multimeric flavodoxin WrbA